MNQEIFEAVREIIEKVLQERLPNYNFGAGMGGHIDEGREGFIKRVSGYIAKSIAEAVPEEKEYDKKKPNWEWFAGWNALYDTLLKNLKENLKNGGKK